MRKMTMLIASFAFLANGISYAESRDLTAEIPDMNMNSNFDKIPDVAQYGEADWDNVIGISRGISLSEAYRIAESNPDITYFFYLKGGQMVLNSIDGNYRVFRHGDAVFFSGQPWWGTAPGFADGYIKKS
jgi:hypothetical protein